MYHTLPNGLRIVHLPIADSEVGYCGFAVNAGSRNEKPSQYGLAHFVEHTLFKGTSKRKAWHILNRMENVGGELNAYTTKEHTFIYSIFMEKDMERAVELMTDLVVNSVFPAKELDKEREVIIDEIQSYEDSPAEIIFDDFENLIFEAHPLGHNILGNRRSLRSLDAAAARAFIDDFYTANNMVFFTMTKTNFRKVIRLAEKYMTAIPPSRPDSVVPDNATGKRAKSTDSIASSNTIGRATVIKKKRTHLSHVIIGCEAYSVFAPYRYELLLLNNILGGMGMNSRLNVSLREKRGLVYSVESNCTAYTDTGAFTVYLGTDPKNRELAMELVEKELGAMRSNRLSDVALRAAKKQAVGQLCVASDNRESRFLSLGKSFLLTNCYETLPEIIDRINNLTASHLLEVANEVFNPQKLFRLVYE